MRKGAIAAVHAAARRAVKVTEVGLDPGRHRPQLDLHTYS